MRAERPWSKLGVAGQPHCCAPQRARGAALKCLEEPVPRASPADWLMPADKVLEFKAGEGKQETFAITFAYQKLHIHSAFPGNSCPNMGPAAFWVISSARDNDSRLCFCCPQETFHEGTGRVAGACREGRGQRACRKGVPMGKPRGRGDQGARGALSQGSR